MQDDVGGQKRVKGEELVEQFIILRSCKQAALESLGASEAALKKVGRLFPIVAEVTKFKCERISEMATDNNK